jgi:hypothetical protein
MRGGAKNSDFTLSTWNPRRRKAWIAPIGRRGARPQGRIGRAGRGRQWWRGRVSHGPGAFGAGADRGREYLTVVGCCWQTPRRQDQCRSSSDGDLVLPLECPLVRGLVKGGSINSATGRRGCTATDGGGAWPPDGAGPRLPVRGRAVAGNDDDQRRRVTSRGTRI